MSNETPCLTLVANSDTRARLVRWLCVKCKNEWRGVGEPPKYCRQCGMDRGYAPDDVPLIGTPSADLQGLPPGILIPEWSGLLPKGLPPGRSMVMRGRPGGGKSRCAIRLGSQLGDRCAVFSIEMGKDLGLETAQLCGASLESLWWYDNVDGLDEIATLSPDVVVVDSIQKLGRGRKRIVAQLRAWASDNGTNVVFISQQHSTGRSRYGEDDDFDCDLVVDVSSRKDDQGKTRKQVHGLGDKRSPCKEGCAHVRVAKSRICALASDDLPIVAGY